MQVTHVYTDGACVPNPGIGGWAFIEKVKDNKAGLVGSGFEFHTTNNRMEYRAAIEAIKTFGPDNTPLVIFTDSELLVKTASEWMFIWEAYGWKRRKKEIKNVDLVKELYALVKQYPVTFTWVKGHAGDYHNTLADQLAGEAVIEAQEALDFV